jgi:hypothetical protein
VAEEEDTEEAGEDFMAGEDSAEADFMGEVLEDILLDSLDIPLVVPYLMDFPEVECTVTVVALVVELAAVVHFLEEAHKQLRTIFQVDPTMEDPLAIRLLV